MKTYKVKKGNCVYLKEERPGNYGITAVFYTITLDFIVPWDDKPRSKRINLSGQFNAKTDDGQEVKEREVYALKASTEIYLHGGFSRDEQEFIIAFISAYKKWNEKNAALVGAIKCEEKRLLAFLETEMKGRRIYSREAFYELPQNKEAVF